MPSMKPEDGTCTECGELYDIIIRELCAQMDYFGQESLTEQQQAFMEMVWNNNIPDRCPECINVLNVSMS